MILRIRRRSPGTEQLVDQDVGRHQAPLQPSCRAPYTSMYLDPRGEVRACCQNEWMRLGNIKDSTLKDLWTGERMMRLRSALASGDHSLGCELCAESDQRSAFARLYDHLGPVEPHPEWPQQLELALSNACNLQCTMCNGELSSSIRIHRERRPANPAAYGEAFFAELDAFLPHLRSLVLLGGEPLLGREPMRVLARLSELELTPHVSITTNGTLWSDEIEAVISARPTHVTVSIDAMTEETMSAVRVGADLDRVRSNAVRFRDATARSGGSMSIAFCLMRPTWSELGSMLSWADELDVDVFVNSVTHPAHMSLLHAPREDLVAVMAALDAECIRRRPSLGRNRPVWDEQLRFVRKVLSERAPMAPTVTTGHDRARRLAATARSQPVSVIQVGPEGLVQAAESSMQANFGIDLQTLIGRSVWDLVGLVATSLGETEASTLTRHDDGIEERFVRFRGNRGTVDFRAALVTHLADQTWYLSFEQIRADRGSVTDPSSPAGG